MQIEKNILFIFQIETWKPQKNNSFYFFKNDDMQCIKDKTLIYMHISKYMVFLFFFYKCKRKTTYKSKHADNKNKAKGTLLCNHQQTLECPKVSINSTWKEGLHKKQVNKFGKVKLTNKKGRKPTPISFWNQTKVNK